MKNSKSNLKEFLDAKTLSPIELKKIVGGESGTPLTETFTISARNLKECFDSTGTSPLTETFTISA